MLLVKSAWQLEQTSTMLSESKASSQQKTNDLFATDIGKMSKYHITYIMFALTREAMQGHKFSDPGVPRILDTLLRVYALNQI